MRSDRLYLADILDAIKAIEYFTAGIDEERFIADELTQSAVLHKLSVIGEAAGRLSEATRAQVPEVFLEGNHRLSQCGSACILFSGLAHCVRDGQRRSAATQAQRSNATRP
jgi:hypothetical protein